MTDKYEENKEAAKEAKENNDKHEQDKDNGGNEQTKEDIKKHLNNTKSRLNGDFLNTFIPNICSIKQSITFDAFNQLITI